MSLGAPAPPPLHALLVPLVDDWLVLPNNAVAEVLGRQRLEAGQLPAGAGPEALPVAANPGLVGRLGAPHDGVPVVRFETLNAAFGPTVGVPILPDAAPPPASGPSDEPGRRARLLLIHGLHSARPGVLPRPWALLGQGPPTLVSLTAAAVTDCGLRPSDNPRWVAARLRVARHEAVVPHLDRLEAWLATTLA